MRFLLFLSALFLLTFNVQAADIYAVADTDISYKLLNQIFGGLVSTNGTGKDAFGSAFATFNGAMLIVGGILVSYTVLIGTIGTAHDGEMLGKKFSSAWVPIRTAIGTCLVLPISASGYCAMQFIVMWFVLQGVGIANNVWSAFLSSPNGAISAKMTPGVKLGIQEFATQVALAQSCVVANKKHMTEDYTGIIKSKLGDYNYSVATTDNLTYYFGDQGGHFSLLTRDSCGKVTLPNLPSKVSVITGTGTSSSNIGKLGSIETNFNIPPAKNIYDKHVEQAKILIDKMGVLAQSSVAGNIPINPSDVKAASDIYITAVENEGNNYVSSVTFINASGNGNGWFLAGSWFTQLVMVNKTIQQNLNIVPFATSTKELSKDTFSWTDSTGATMSKSQELLLLQKENVKTSNVKDLIKKEGSKDDSSAYNSIVTSLTSTFSTVDLLELKNDSRHPIVIMQEMGQRMLDVWQIGMGTLTTLGAVTGRLDSGAVLRVLLGFFTIPLAAILAIGFTLAYILPNLPFLIWIGVVFGWLIMVVEAVIAAPLWAVMHLHPDGDEMAGRGDPGYMLLFDITVKPVLIIAGLIVSMTLAILMGEFINKVFFEIFYIGSNSGVLSIIATIFSIGIYTMAQFTMFKKVFDLMYLIPDQILKWIGGNKAKIGRQSKAISKGSEQGMATATVLGSSVGEDAVDLSGNIASRFQKSKEDQNDLNDPNNPDNPNSPNALNREGNDNNQNKQNNLNDNNDLKTKNNNED